MLNSSGSIAYTTVVIVRRCTMMVQDVGSNDNKRMFCLEQNFSEFDQHKSNEETFE